MKKNLLLPNKFGLYFLLLFISLKSTNAFDNYNIQLLSKLPLPASISSCWGYNDTIKNKEYALVGIKTGTSIVDISNPTNPVQVALVPGSSGGSITWREMKTYSHYAYIVHDVNESLNEGLQIVDLQYLPDSVKIYNVKTLVQGTNTITFNQQHTCFIDDSGFLYINGGNFQNKINGVSYSGTLIFDLKPNPIEPTYVGKASIRYVHDCFVRGNLLFQAHTNSPNAKKFTIWNIQDRSNPILIQDFQTPYGTTHNTWLSDDSKTLFVTHEEYNLPIEGYDISDLSNIHQISEFRIAPNNQEIAHNVHVLNDFIVVPYYSEGVAIFDAIDPTNVVTVGYYDTRPTTTRTEDGVWGAYPYLKSGNIILSDMSLGMFLVKPTYIRAARIQGTVTDTNTTQVLAGVKISFADTITSSSLTSVDGLYKTGSVKAGLTRFKAEKTGYVTKYFYATLVNGSTVTVDVQLRQTPIEVKISAAFCENKSYTLPNGSKVTEPGIYYTNYVLPSGKDSIIKTTLTELPASYTSKTVHLCDGDSYQLPDGSFTSAEGTYYDTLQNSISCDSVITTSVFKHPEYAIFKTDSFNLGSTYTLPNGTTTTTGGTFVSNLLTAVYGCDSVITIDLKTISVTGIRNNSGEIQLKFVVNNNTLQLISKANIQLKELQLYNALGEMVIAYVNPERLLYLPVLPKGIYIIRATTTDNEEYTGKISPF